MARDYAVSFGGNAVSAAFCCAKLGVVPDLMTSLADDWLARMFLDMAAKYGVLSARPESEESSLSFVMPNHGMRAIIRCRDDHYLHPVPPLDLTGCRALHLDGHQADAAIQYAKHVPRAGILTSLDGGGHALQHAWSCSNSSTSRSARNGSASSSSSRREALCALLKQKGCRDRRRHAGCAGPALVRRGRQRSADAGARGAEERGDRHQRRGRHLPRRLCVFLSDARRGAVGDALPLRARGLGAFGAPPRDRGTRCRRGPTSQAAEQAFREAA